MRALLAPAGKGAESQAGSTWVKFYDPLYKDYFFYNEITGEKVEAKGLSKTHGLFHLHKRTCREFHLQR